MTWNYRIVRFKDKTCRNGVYYKVQEVCYLRKRPASCCDISIGGETIKECFEDLQLIIGDMGKAYLKYPEDFNQGPPTKGTGKHNRKEDA